MKSNMDVKFIGSGDAAKAMLYYVTDYITKASLPTHIGLGALTYAIQKTNAKFDGVDEVGMDDRQRLSALTTQTGPPGLKLILLIRHAGCVR